MKKTFLILSMLVFLSLNSFSQVKFLDLPIWQLKELGIYCSKDGVFYKNQDKNGLLCLYLVDDNYCTHMNLKAGESFTTKVPVVLKNMESTRLTFEPVMVTSGEGSPTWDAYTYVYPKGTKLVPVRINLTDLQMKKRKDWIIFWFRPTEELKLALRDIADPEKFAADPFYHK